MRWAAFALLLYSRIAFAFSTATPLSATGTAASGVGVTITLPAGGANTFQVISRIILRKYVTAAITANAAPLRMRTTNLLNLSWIFRNVGAVADMEIMPYQPMFNPPIAATTANTAVTFICPATTGIIWDCFVLYSIGPASSLQ